MTSLPWFLNGGGVGMRIFEFSDLGIIGDLNKILPKLTEAVKAKKGG